MNRNILLLEPNYKNKYPPLGLMKISTYYKMLGDRVTFFKGEMIDLVLGNIYSMLIEQLYANDRNIFWEEYKNIIISYIRSGERNILRDIPKANSDPIISDLFRFYREFFFRKKHFEQNNRIYDRICITTLFTFYWDMTIKTIDFAKKLCKTHDGIQVGGIMASILYDRIEKETGVKPFIGTLDKPGILDRDNNIIIDSLPLDYSILEEVDYQYPVSNAYFAYMTRGCINKCKFCAVPKIEQSYVNYLPISDQIHLAERQYGKKANLLLLDNNVLASDRFDDIIDDIKRSGFSRDETYIQPNLYEIAINNLRNGHNETAYIKLCVKQFRLLIRKKNISGLQDVYNLLRENRLLSDYTANKCTILSTYNILSPFFNQFYSKKQKKRYVDFNQGLDARLINDYNMRRLAEISIKPVRIAFDHWSQHNIYEKAVRIAVRNGHTHLSNYLLYNFEDHPIDLYLRLRLNIELSEELDANIYSFPMKYHPIDDPKYFDNRNFIGKHWNKKFIRAIQAILNSTKGKVGQGHDFFYKAFGKNEEEYFKILYMPESMIIYRHFFEENGITDDWWASFISLSHSEQNTVKSIIEKNIFDDSIGNNKIQKVLRFYKISRNLFNL